jgi:putative ubiquitin-RnfH superfamily antitoxin RatB of RatAB toxin-antitoxin module
MSDITLSVEVAYASATVQRLITVEVPVGSTVDYAIQASGVLELFPEIDLDRLKVGIFSRPCDLLTVLRAHDRIEIYRPLQADPKDSRRERVAAVRARTGRLR